MKPLSFVLTFGLLLGIASGAAEKPNILLIVSDDAGYSDFGFQGSKEIPTPHLDKLSAGGLRLTQGYVAGCVCSPSRAALLTGKSPARIGHENNLGGDKGGVDTASELMPARLKACGYHTGGIGKWHLGSRDEYLPWKRGFDVFIGFLGGGSNYLAAKGKPVKLLRNGVETVEKEYLTDAFSREAADFIGRNARPPGSAAPPWFLYLAYNAVHSPMQPPVRGEEKFSGLGKKRAVLAAMTSSLDHGVGRVLAKLESTGQTANTLVVFINDNGGATYGGFHNAPLRGHKGTLFEGGIRVPFLVRWPGVIPEGKTFTQPACATDLLATFLDAAGATESKSSDGDGVNLLPYLAGSKTGSPHETLFWRFNVVAAVRAGDWKLIRIRGEKPLLFDLSKDPAEAVDLAAKEPARVDELLKRIGDWEKPFPPPKWTEGEQWEKIHVRDHVKPAVYQGAGGDGE